MLHGFFFNTPAETSYIGHQISEIYKDRVYESLLIGKSDLVILDIGAMGFTSYYFSQFAKSVYSFEPASEAFETLQFMVDFNKLSNVTPLKLALANNDGEANLAIVPQNKTMNSLTPAGGMASGSERVKTIRLDTFMIQNNISHVDFMKLDVEGFEANIICGDGFQNVASKIDVILLETHNWMDRNFNQLKEGFKQAGFTMEQIPNDASLWVCKRI